MNYRKTLETYCGRSRHYMFEPRPLFETLINPPLPAKLRTQLQEISAPIFCYIPPYLIVLRLYLSHSFSHSVKPIHVGDVCLCISFITLLWNLKMSTGTGHVSHQNSCGPEEVRPRQTPSKNELFAEMSCALSGEGGSCPTLLIVATPVMSAM